MIDLVPLKLFSSRIEEGWTMVAGYPLQPGDYAVTMQSPGHREVRSNTSRAWESGAKKRQVGRWKKREAELA